MIDTVILRIHDLEKYSWLIKDLSYKNNSGYTLESATISNDDIMQVRKEGFKTERQIIDVLKSRKSGEFLLKTQAGKQISFSHHYTFSYFINYTKNYIEFNFSIPKYKYGSNVLMFIEHWHDPRFKYWEASTLEHNLKITPELFFSFIEAFLRLDFLWPIDFKDVEIDRIDVCFNQLFASKQEAFKYLEYQKRLKKKYAREEEGVMREYATSLMYVTKRFSAKIYHKGSEYTKHDLKEHEKINKEKGLPYFNIEKLQLFSDRMLRYELAIRNQYLNYIFKQNIFRKNCIHYKRDYRNYLRIENAIQRNDRIAEKAGKLSKEEKKVFLEANPYERISRDDRDNYKYVSKILTKKTYFMLQCDEDTEYYNHQTVNYLSDKATFSKPLLKLCLRKLLTFIEEFQIKELPDDEIVKQSIIKHNLYAKQEIPKVEMLHFYDLLIKYGSFKEAAKYGNLSRATMYRYKDRFKKIGITERHMKPLEDYSIPDAPLDMKDYHYFLIYVADLLKGIRVFQHYPKL